MPESRPGWHAREAAVAMVVAVLDKHQPLDRFIETELRNTKGLGGLDQRDRALARMIAATTCRRLGEIDRALAACLNHPLPRNAHRARAVLRTGAAQILFMRLAPHASVDISVALAPKPQTGLVNAVLRRLAREEKPAEAAVINLPAWLKKRWEKTYGTETMRAIAAALLKTPTLDITAKAPTAALAERLGATLLPTGTLRRARAGRVEEIPDYAEGTWWAQDMAAALPARLLFPVAGERILDMCAAPGGKAAQLAHAGAALTALERDAGRARTLGENLKRLRLEAEIINADATRWKSKTGCFEGVLLDAPCLGTGAMRRHPDLIHLKREGDLTHLSALQDELLNAAGGHLAPGGRLVYCVCSLEPEDGIARITAFLGRHADMRRAPIEASEIEGLDQRLLTKEGDMLCLPCHYGALGGMDGFYAARMIRTR